MVKVAVLVGIWILFVVLRTLSFKVKAQYLTLQGNLGWWLS